MSKFPDLTIIKIDSEHDPLFQKALEIAAMPRLIEPSKPKRVKRKLSSKSKIKMDTMVQEAIRGNIEEDESTIENVSEPIENSLWKFDPDISQDMEERDKLGEKGGRYKVLTPEMILGPTFICKEPLDSDLKNDLSSTVEDKILLQKQIELFCERIGTKEFSFKQSIE